jgi:hypothetical protein
LGGDEEENWAGGNYLKIENRAIYISGENLKSLNNPIFSRLNNIFA